MSAKRTSLAWVTLLVLATGAPAATAGPFRLVGYDSHSTRQQAYGGGPGVLYSNPALLIDLQDHFGFGLILIQPHLEAKLMDRPANADIPITFYDSDVGIQGANLDRPLPTAELPNPRANNRQRGTTGYLGLGLVHSLGIEDFRLGLLLVLPSDGFAAVSSHFPDEREQYFSNTLHFTRFGEWSRVLSLLAGIAYRPVPWLSLGASVEASLGAGAVLDVFVPEATVQDYALANAVLDARPSVRGILGVSFRPIEHFSFSLVFRDRRFTRIDTRAGLNLWNYHEPGDETIPKRVIQNHLLALDFEPMEVSLAAGLAMGQVKVELGVSWNHWSDYLDTHHQRAQYTAVADWVGEGAGGEAQDPDFAFSDTFSFSLGFTWEYLRGLSLQAGAVYRPTPVPAQTGRTNYLDHDLLSLAVGHSFAFELWGRQLHAELGLQFWTMFEQTVHKDPSRKCMNPDCSDYYYPIPDEFADHAKTLLGGQVMPEAQGLQTNNPGFPGTTFGGFALVGSASLSYLF